MTVEFSGLSINENKLKSSPGIETPMPPSWQVVKVEEINVVDFDRKSSKDEAEEWLEKNIKGKFKITDYFNQNKKRYFFIGFENRNEAVFFKMSSKLV